MKFQPKTEEQISLSNLVPEGIYDFTVVDAKDDISKSSGNPMIKLKLIIWDEKGKPIVVYDYLLESMAFKLKHFCESVGLKDKYESGEFEALDCVDKSARVQIVIQKGNERYPDKNSVKDYVKSELKKTNKDEFKDDDLPWL